MTAVADILRKIEASLDAAAASLGDEFSQKGTILEIKDGVATVTGLQKVRFSEIVEFENGTKGLVMDLLKDQVGVLILGNYGTLSQ